MYLSLSLNIYIYIYYIHIYSLYCLYAVSSLSLHSHDFRLRVSNPRAIAHVYVSMPFCRMD